jgi:hypothetical protein
MIENEPINLELILSCIAKSTCSKIASPKKAQYLLMRKAAMDVFIVTYPLQIYWPSNRSSQVPIILGFHESSCVVVILPIVEFEAKLKVIESLFLL